MKSFFGESNVYRLITVNEIKFDALSRPNNILFSVDSDYIKLIELVRKYPDLKEIEIKSASNFKNIIDRADDKYLPVLLKKKR